jgi:hypothetical protein
MTKLAIKVQKIFGATGPTGVLGQFGSLKAGSPTYSNDPDTIQALSGYGQGIDGASINSAPPAIQDVNSLSYLISRQIAYLMQTSVSEWDAATTYYIGSIINDGLGNLYTSITDDNLNNVITDSSNWLNMTSNFSRDVSGDVTFANEDYCIVYPVGATGPSGTVALPTPGDELKGRKIIVADFTQAGGVTFVAKSICTGTKWVYESLALTFS